ncbi:MAG TPA: FAD-binding oxidoreductase, partial [Steroidobacteraceae bacterium]|nr:FAD-binding oxidoreductase [Steroidobacteraceae bacterium]
DASPLEAAALVRPSTTKELSRLMRLCHARSQPVVIHGGRTGVCDGDRAGPQDVVISLERMAAIEEIDAVGRTATVQAGCTLQAMQNAAEERGLFFALDLGARGSCTIGGNVATNAGGSNVLRYGMMRAQVLGLEAVLADGTIVSSMNRMLKNNTGYDLKQLFIGSEGTLGIVTRVIVGLHERSSSLNTALVAIDGGEKLPLFLKHMDRALGGTLSSFEAMWGEYYREVTKPGRHTAPLGREHAFYVIAESQGPDPENDARRFEDAVTAALEGGLVVDAVLPKSGTERDRIWAIRENFEALFEQRPVFLYDVSVPIKAMLAYVEEVEAAIVRQWPNGRFFVLGHVADGNLHFFVIPGATQDDPAQLHRLSDEMVYRPLAHCGGAVSAEHGTGLEKKAWMSVTRNSEEIELMRLLKRTLDPRNILNRGKVLDLARGACPEA